DDLQKHVSEGTLTVSRSNDILTLALGTPEHGGRVRGVEAGVSLTQLFNFPRQQRVKFADKLKESVMEAVRAEREILWKQINQLIPNFDPNLLNKTPITPSPKNPMSDKASCSNVIPFPLEEVNPTNDADATKK
ncbi:PREDICTED: transposon CACTA En/Spm, partial [Prunus dulcis]